MVLCSEFFEAGQIEGQQKLSAKNLVDDFIGKDEQAFESSIRESAQNFPFFSNPGEFVLAYFEGDALYAYAILK